MVVLATSKMYEGNTFLTLAAQDVYMSTCVSTNLCAAKSKLQMGDATKDAANVSKEALRDRRDPSS